MSVDAIAKLAQYTIGLLADPLLATWRARREVAADRIRAEGQAEFMEILAVGEARASAEAMLELVGGSQRLAELIDVEIDQRVESLFEKRLRNLAQIVEKATHALPSGKVPDAEPDMAWTASFSNAAQDISDEHMQNLWARALAGEVGTPGNTSVRTLTILRNMDQSSARLFTRLCSMAATLLYPSIGIVDCRVPSLGGNAGSNSLTDFGLSFDDLNVLHEYELIIADFNSWRDYRLCIAESIGESRGWTVDLPFVFQGRQWGLIPNHERDREEELRVSGVSLTRAGRELSKLVELEPVPKYERALRDYFSASGLEMERVRHSA